MLEILKEKRITVDNRYYGSEDKELVNGVKEAINEVVEKKRFEQSDNGISPHTSLRMLVNVPFSKIGYEEYELHIKRVRKCLFKVLHQNPNIMAIANWEDIFVKAVLSQLFFETLFNEDRVRKMSIKEKNSFMVFAMQALEKVYVDKTEEKGIASGIFMNLFRGMDN